MRDKRYSAIIFDGCNFDCPFCFENDRDPNGDQRTNIGEISLDQVIDFALKEVAKGNPIEITGGECTNQPQALFELINEIDFAGGYINLATNGSRPKFIRKIVGKIDCLGLDIKSPENEIKFYTRREELISFTKPLELLKESVGYGCDVHFKRIMFKTTRFEDLEFFYPYAAHAFWILKQLRPFYNSGSCPDSLLPMDSEELKEITAGFIQSHPSLTGRLVTIADGSGRNQKNYTYY
jgi:organic radical activating enzyme